MRMPTLSTVVVVTVLLVPSLVVTVVLVSLVVGTEKLYKPERDWPLMVH
jgi:hypothetical protein